MKRENERKRLRGGEMERGMEVHWRKGEMERGMRKSVGEKERESMRRREFESPSQSIRETHFRILDRYAKFCQYSRYWPIHADIDGILVNN